MHVNLESLLTYGFTHRLRETNNQACTLRWSSSKFGGNEYWFEFELGSRFRDDKAQHVAFCFLHWNLGGSTNFVHIPNIESVQTIFGLNSFIYTFSGGLYEPKKKRTPKEVAEIIDRHTTLFSLFGLLEGQQVKQFIQKNELRV